MGQRYNEDAYRHGKAVAKEGGERKVPKKRWGWSKQDWLDGYDDGVQLELKGKN